MTTINIREAKAHLSKLVDLVVSGETVVIARAGKELVRIVALDAPAAPARLGFLAGEIAMTDDFDRMGQAEITTQFGTFPRNRGT